jgi:cephalosporin-C deacetylase-like acetyl esterase
MYTSLPVLAVIVVFCSQLLAGAAPLSSDALLSWLDRIAQKQLDQRDTEIAKIQTRDSAEQRKKLVREKLLKILGGLPDYSGPLNARVTAQITARGYVIEKVIFESLPGFYVTANLYRPEQPGRYPAVLLSAGHLQSGKTEPQLIAANFALKGFVALTYDPLGQGERQQTFDSRLSGALAGWGTNEHIQAGAQALLAGQSVARFFIWDSKRALDYLVSRPDVDPDRLGCAGCSGGGTQTTYIAALDPRVKAAAPACYINSFRLLFTGATPDNEMSIVSLLSEGLDMADFIELSAPAPWMIQATEGDYFTPAGARMVYEEAKRWYHLYGAPEKLEFFVGSGPHGMPPESREALYRWMIRWLKDGKGDAKERSVKLYPDLDLQVTRTGQVEDEPGSRRVHQIILEDVSKVVPSRKLQLPNAKPPRTTPSVRVVEETTTDGVRAQRLALESEPGITLDARLWIPQSQGRKSAVLTVLNKSSEENALKLARRGHIVLAVQPRHSSTGYDSRPYLGDWRTNTRAGLVGRSLALMRAQDLVRGVDFLTTREDVSEVRAVASGVSGVWLLLAAAADPRIAAIWLDRTPHSLRSALETPLTTELHDAVIPGALLDWDLDDLLRSMGTRRVLWTDPSNWMRRPVAVKGAFRYRYLNQSDDDFWDEFLH